MSPATAAVHVPAFKRREAAREQAVLNPTPETMKAQLANCEGMMRRGQFGYYRQQEVVARIAELKTQLGHE